MSNINKFLRVASIIDESIVDGPGMRMTVFAQGCPHRCLGCYNPQTHLKSGGKTISIEEIVRKYQNNVFLNGITLSGGEPFIQADNFATLAKNIHQLNGNVFTYTGYTYEYLKTQDFAQKLLQETDVLVDGPYIQNLRDLELLYRGSKNQRLIPLTNIGKELLEEVGQ